MLIEPIHEGRNESQICRCVRVVVAVVAASQMMLMLTEGEAAALRWKARKLGALRPALVRLTICHPDSNMIRKAWCKHELDWRQSATHQKC